MIDAGIYDIITGRIKRRVFVQESQLALQPKSGEGIIVGLVDQFTQYVIHGDDPILMLRSDSIADFDVLAIVADGIAVVTLSDLPIPCTIIVDSQSMEVLDGEFQLAANTPGDYKIRMQAVEFKQKEWVIHAS